MNFHGYAWLRDPMMPETARFHGLVERYQDNGACPTCAIRFAIAKIANEKPMPAIGCVDPRACQARMTAAARRGAVYGPVQETA